MLGGHDSATGTVAGLHSDVADRATGLVPVTPARLRAVVLNVTAVTPSEQTHVTVYPSGQAPPDASNLNARPGTIVPNQVVARVGTDGKIVLRNAAGNTHLVADVSGYFTSAEEAARYSPLPPSRLLDTRDGTGGLGRSPITLDVRGRGGIPTTGVQAVVLNVTAVNASTPGVVTVHPASAPLPLASNLNTRPGGVFPNLVTVAVPPDGRVSFWNSAGTVDLVADVAGWYGDGAESSFVSLSPIRLFDSRDAVPEVGDEDARLWQDEVWELDVAAGGVPVGASAVALNVTSVLPTQQTVLTVYPSDLPEPPLASNLNPSSSAIVVAGSVLVRTSPDTFVSVWNAWGTTHLVVDVNGYFVS